MFSKNNKKMIAERSAERTLKYGLVKLNVGLASVLLATGLTFVGSQAASADTVTTSTEAQTTEVAPGQNDAATQTENQGLTKETATESLKDAKATQDKAQGEVTEATKNVEDATTVRNDAKDVEASAQKDLDASLQAKKDIPAATDKVKEDSAALDNARDDVDKAQDTSRQNYAEANKANEQAQSDLAQATAKNAEAQGAVNNAQSDVNKASENVQSAANAERNAQTVVDQAQSEANNAQSDYNNAVSQATQTDQAAKQAQEDLSKANQAVSDAQKTADAAIQQQAQAQSNADTATQNVDAANAQVQKSQGEVEKAQGNVKTAQNDVSNAQNHEQVVAQDTQDVTAKTNAKNAADAKVNDAKKTSDEKNTAKNNAESDVANAQKTVDQLSKSDTSAPVKESINVNQDYINLMKKVQERLMSPSNTTGMDFNAEEGQEYGKLAQLLQPQQHYVNDPNLAKIPVKINSDGTLSKADQIDATQFYFSLINPIRKAIGMPELKISEDALQMTTNIAKQYNADDWCIDPQKVINQNGFDIVSYDTSNPHFGQHDTNAIDKNGAANENVIAVPNNTSTIYNTPDDPTSGIKDFHYNTTTWATNRDELHQAMFENAVGGLLEYGNTPGHAENLLGLHIPALNTGNGFAAVQTDKFGQVHFNVESSSINDTSNEIPVETSSTDDHASQLTNAKQALQDAQAKLATATTEASQADTALASAQAEAQKATEELKNAQDKLAQDQSSSMSIEQAQAELQKAQSTLVQKQANLTDAKTAAQKAQAMQSQADSPC